MAADRAHTIATTIQKILSHIPLVPSGTPSRIASKAPVKAKGRAKTECSNLIISSVSRRRFQGIPGVSLFYRPGADKMCVAFFDLHVTFGLKSAREGLRMLEACM